MLFVCFSYLLARSYLNCGLFFFSGISDPYLELIVACSLQIYQWQKLLAAVWLCACLVSVTLLIMSRAKQAKLEIFAISVSKVTAERTDRAVTNLFSTLLKI